MIARNCEFLTHNASAQNLHPFRGPTIARDATNRLRIVFSTQRHLFALSLLPYDGNKRSPKAKYVTIKF
jgi:hypothetical protein